MQRKPNLFEYIIERPRLSIVTGTLLILIGFLVSDLPKMISTLGWPTTSGTIISRQIQSIRLQEYDGDFYEEIHISIRYEYAVDETRYESWSIDARDLAYYPPEIAEKYPVDKKVIVYYNPKEPIESVLEPGVVNIFKAFDVFSYLFFFGGAYFIYAGIRKQKENDFWQTYTASH